MLLGFTLYCNSYVKVNNKQSNYNNNNNNNNNKMAWVSISVLKQLIKFFFFLTNPFEKLVWVVSVEC